MARFTKMAVREIHSYFAGACRSQYAASAIAEELASPRTDTYEQLRSFNPKFAHSDGVHTSIN